MMGLATLPEKDLAVVVEVISDLQIHSARSAADIVTRARQRASEMKNLPREEVFKQLRLAMDAIRAQAIAQGTAIDHEEEWRGD